MIIRTIDEIKQKIEEGFKTDVFGFGKHDIAEALPFEDVKDILLQEFLSRPDAKELWEKDRLKTKEDVLRKMRDYLDFAWEKANNGRGLSADRSIQHYIAWSWLIDEELHNELIRMYLEEYDDYGKNILKYIENWLNNQ